MLKSRSLILFLTLCIIVVLGFTYPFYQIVAFEHENTGRLLAYIPATEGRQFDIKYIHSIHLTPVYESYRIKQQHLIQYQIRYEEFGIGMPSGAEEHESFYEENGQYVITGMNHVIPLLDMRVAQTTKSQELIVDEKNIAFTSFAKPGAWVRIKVKKINLWTLLKGGNVLD